MTWDPSDDTPRAASHGRLRLLGPLVSLGGRAATTALRPLNGAVEAAIEVGVTLERRAVDRVLGSDELERVMVEATESPRIQSALQVALSSEAASQLVDSFFDSGMFDRLVERLLVSDGLWHLVDVIAQSPAVTAAISQQGLGFADQVGDQVRERSRQTDDWLERTARRMIGRRHRAVEPGPGPDPDPSAA